MAKSYLQDPSKIFEKINEAIANAVYIFDLDDKFIVWLNKPAEELCGYTAEEIRVMGANYYVNVMHPEDIPYLEKLVAQCRFLKEGQTLVAEYRIKDRNGTYHWVHDSITSFTRDAKGNVVAVLGVATAIDDLKARQSLLSKTVQKLNTSLDAAKMGTWEWDIEQNKLHWDDRMYQIHDILPGPEVSPMDEIWKRAEREDMEQTNLKTLEALEKKQDLFVTYRLKYDNDEIHHIRVYGKILESDPTRMVGVGWDSTDEILTVKEMAEAKARLISSTKMAALGEMSGGIAHEINNPLTVIQARSFQLSQMVETGKIDPAKIKIAAESISRTADKIAKIIKSLRSFAREGTQDPFELVPVNQLIDETLEFCRTRFYNHGVEIEVENIDPDLEVECRVIQIEQVLLNLLNNSFDAIQSLETRWIRISVHEVGESLEITVKDSGSGIPMDVQDQIMLPFFTTKEVGKGTGLGLSISSGIMNSHKGTLRLEPQLENTTFVIHLPKLQEPSDH